MKKILSQTIGYIVLFAALCSTSYASDANQTFELTLINHSEQTLIVHSIASAQGVIIQPSEELWTPGSVIQVHCENISSNGILGHIRFLDGNRHLAQLRIDIREQRHTGQPVIGMNDGQHYQSTVLSKTRNPSTGGRFLSYISGTVELKDKK